MRSQPDVDQRRVNHADAFCLMTYASPDGRELEVIYNNRDGPVPMCITLRSGKEGARTRIAEDVRIFDQPPVGTRMFVDLDLATARARARAKAEQFPDSFPTPREDLDDAIERLAQSWVGDGHMPHLVEVGTTDDVVGDGPAASGGGSVSTSPSTSPGDAAGGGGGS